MQKISKNGGKRRTVAASILLLFLRVSHLPQFFLHHFFAEKGGRTKKVRWIKKALVSSPLFQVKRQGATAKRCSKV